MHTFSDFCIYTLHDEKKDRDYYMYMYNMSRMDTYMLPWKQFDDISL